MIASPAEAEKLLGQAVAVATDVADRYGILDGDTTTIWHLSGCIDLAAMRSRHASEKAPAELVAAAFVAHQAVEFGRLMKQRPNQLGDAAEVLRTALSSDAFTTDISFDLLIGRAFEIAAATIDRHGIPAPELPEDYRLAAMRMRDAALSGPNDPLPEDLDAAFLLMIDVRHARENPMALIGLRDRVK